MNFIESIQDYGLELLGRYYSKYRGVVVDNKDPNNQNKILVQVPGILNGEPIIASPANQLGGMDYGVKPPTPRIGSVVWVEFENGIPLKAIWSYHGWADGECPKDLQPVENFGIVTPGGNKVIFNEVDNSLYIKVVGKSVIETDDDVSLTTKGNVNLKSEKDVTIEASTINFIKGEEGLLKAGKLLKELNDTKEALRKVMTFLRNFSPTGTSADTATWKGLVNINLPPTLTITDTQVSDVTNEKVKQEK